MQMTCSYLLYRRVTFSLCWNILQRVWRSWDENSQFNRLLKEMQFHLGLCFHLEDQPAQTKWNSQADSGCTGGITSLEVQGKQCSHLPNRLDPHPDRRWKREHPSIFFFNCHLLLIRVKVGCFPSGGSNTARIDHQSIIHTRWQIIGLRKETGLQEGSELVMNLKPFYEAPFQGCNHPSRTKHSGLRQQSSCNIWSNGYYQWHRSRKINIWRYCFCHIYQTCFFEQIDTGLRNLQLPRVPSVKDMRERRKGESHTYTCIYIYTQRRHYCSLLTQRPGNREKERL